MRPTPRSASKFKKVRNGTHRAVYCPDARPISPRLPPLVSTGGSVKPAFLGISIGAVAFLSVAVAIVRAAIH